MTPIVWHYVKSLKWSTVGHSEKPVVRIVCNCTHSTGAVVFPDDTPEARHKALAEAIDEHTQHCEDAVAKVLIKRIERLKNKREEDHTVAYFHHPKSATERVGLCGVGGIMAAMAPGGVVPVSAVSCPKCLALMSPARERDTYVENTTSREQEGQ